MGEIVLNPVYGALHEEVANLRNDIADLIIEHDELLFHTSKNIEADYMLKIGILEYKANEYQCKVLRIKRKIELIQGKLNKQELVFLPQIEQQLDDEFHQYLERLKEQLNVANRALQRFEIDVLTVEDNDELKKWYHQVIIKLHPVLNSGRLEQQKQLYQNAVNAFENADLSTMKMIALLIEEISPEAGFLNGIEELQKKRNLLIEQKNEIINNIIRIKNSFPYNTLEFLNNSQKINTKKQELNEIIEQYRSLYAEYEENLMNILR